MPSWPLSGKPLLNGYSPDHEPSVRRTEMEDGPPRQQALSSHIKTIIPMSVYVTAAEYSTVMTWWRDTIKFVQWFDVDIVTMGTLASHSARIVGKIRPTPMGREFKLSFTVETYELNT